MDSSVFLKRIALSNYKSIKECNVKPGPLTFLVGQNGAGKSNFLDALRLVTESLNTSLEHALRDRGGINEVRRRSAGHPTHFGIRLDWQLADGTEGMYAFRVKSMEKGGFAVQREECRIFGKDLDTDSFYKVEDGVLKEHNLGTNLPVNTDRLLLVVAAGIPKFKPLYNALSHMGFYSLNPDEIRELQPSDAGEVLRRDGGNLASVLELMKRENKETHDRVINFLSTVVPGIQSVDVKHIGKKETLEFRQNVGNSNDPWRFMAENMSDGTLRALGILTALFQSSSNSQKKVPFVGIEEPEVALHPGAAGILRDALLSASRKTQIIVTSHSPDLLDDKDISESCIWPVINENGETKIGPLDLAGKKAIRERLYTPGELLRMSQLEPDCAEYTTSTQPELFANYTYERSKDYPNS